MKIYDTIIIGGGQAGLAMGYQLTAQGYLRSEQNNKKQLKSIKPNYCTPKEHRT